MYILHTVTVVAVRVVQALEDVSIALCDDARLLTERNANVSIDQQ